MTEPGRTCHEGQSQQFAIRRIRRYPSGGRRQLDLEPSDLTGRYERSE